MAASGGRGRESSSTVLFKSVNVPNKPKRPCSKPGCNVLTDFRYCDMHIKEQSRIDDRMRGSAHERGYTSRWQRYSKWFLSRPENVLCKLELVGCTIFSRCVDHIDPPNGPDDPRFWDTTNHQSACIHCNSVKGRKKMVGLGGMKLEE